MSTRMHDGDFRAAVVGGFDVTRVRRSRLFLHRQCVHIRPHENSRSAAVFHDRDDAVSSQSGISIFAQMIDDRVAGGAQLLGEVVPKSALS